MKKSSKVDVIKEFSDLYETIYKQGQTISHIFTILEMKDKTINELLDRVDELEYQLSDTNTYKKPKTVN